MCLLGRLEVGPNRRLRARLRRRWTGLSAPAEPRPAGAARRYANDPSPGWCAVSRTGCLALWRLSDMLARSGAIAS